MVGSKTKYASYRNIQGSISQLPTGVVVASALQKWSIWKHNRASRRFVQRYSLNIKPLYAPFAIASKYCAFGEKREKPTLSAFALWDGRKAEITDKVKKEVETNLLNEALYLLTQKYTDHAYTKINEAKKVFKSRFANKRRWKWAFFAKRGEKKWTHCILSENSKISSMFTRT